MYRQSLAPDRGMIFPYDPPQTAAFWMKNTLIPLDMIFIRADGRSPASPPIRCRCRSTGAVGRTGRRGAGDRRRALAELGIHAGDKVEWAR